MALTSSMSEDWGGGMYRGRKAPANTFYDGVNALINDEGLPFKRGGSAYKSNADVASLAQVVDVYVVAGPRTLAWDRAVSPAMYALATNDATLTAVQLDGGGSIVADSRVAIVHGELVALSTLVPGQLLTWAGSRKTASAYSTGTVAVTQGSTTVTGTGTLWAANIEPGDYLETATGIGIVKKVTSNTQITLVNPWTPATASGQTYTLQATTTFNPGGLLGLPAAIKNTVATVAGRLVVTMDNRAYFTGRDNLDFTASDYIDLQDGSNIIGSDSISDALVLFTTAGVWVVANMALDDVDDYANVQWQQQQVSKDLILWDDLGIAASHGALVVPGVEDVVVFSLDGSTQVLSESIRPLYRSYVKAGYRPGQATVHRGHYFLPILNGNALVDELVCRLDRPYQDGNGRVLYPWTRWSGHAAGVAFTQRIGSTTRSPKLFAVSGSRIVDLTSCLDPTSSNAQDADATNFDCTLTTRDYPTSQRHGFVQRMRLRYELTDDGSGGTTAPTVAVAFSSDQDAGSFTTLTDKGLQAGGAGGAVSAGDKYNWWTVGKKRERIRYRITQTGACASFILRSLEMLTRPPGRQ